MSEGIYSKDLIDFKNKFSPDILKNLSGLELLKRLAYPKNIDENIKKQFDNLYEADYNSLKNELENGMFDYGSGSAGYDINFVLAYRQGSWYNLKEKISLKQAIEIAEKIKHELTDACEFLSNNDFDGFYNYVLKSTLNLFNKGYTHKYLHILYPNYISFYHAGNWQSYYKSCLNLPKTNNYYDLEKYLIDNFPSCNVGEKSRELEKQYGIPSKKYWLLTWNPDKWDWKTFFDDLEAVCKGEHIESKHSCLSKKPRIGDRVYILKLGTQTPKGIIASGYISKESYSDIAEHTEDNQVVNCVKIKYDKIINYNNKILEQSFLKEKFPKQEWSPQASGIEIKKEYTKELENIWSNYNNNFKKEIKYWTYRAGENSRMWEECSNKNIIALGWDYLGDLKQYSSKEELKEKISYTEQKNNPMNNVLACWEFANCMDIGDIVYVEKGRNCIIARGIVDSDYIYDNTREEYKNIRKIQWTHKELHKLDFILDVKTLTNISQTKYGDYCLKIEAMFNNKRIQETPKMINQSLNLILYGPPGTGKTYSIQEYIQNLLGENPGLNINSEEQKLNDIVKDLSWYTTIAISMYLNGEQNKYKVSDLMNQKIIKAFALTRENKNLRAALWAQMQIHTSEDCKTVNYTNRQAPFVFEKNENSEWYLTGDGIKYVEENLADQIAQYKAPSNTRKIEDFYKFITFHQSYSYEEFVEGIKPKIDVNDDSSTISYEYNRGIFKEICQQANSDPDNKYLLIIDEINRGNISKIFGELITLIETNKRVRPNKERYFENTKVDKEQLLVTLPYTKSKFGVPSNLYILGTMNTSDRSIASIDIALRRRFKFVEMMPRPEKLVDKNNQPLMVEDINLQNLLKTINERISYILDRDHQIGHSYFMNWKNYDMTTLKNVWFDEIMPLLNEYFYSDWDKLQAILGKANEIGVEKSFIVKIKKPNLPYEADCSDEEAYYNFSKKEETNDDDFKMMLENAKLV